MLALSDDIRESLRETHDLEQYAELFLTYFGSYLKQEVFERHMVDFATLKQAYLDQLLEEIINDRDGPGSGATRSRAVLKVAQSLQHQWRTRFGENYLDLTDSRYRELATCGRMKNITLLPATASDQPIWQAMKCTELSALEGDVEFEPG